MIMISFFFFLLSFLLFITSNFLSPNHQVHHLNSTPPDSFFCPHSRIKEITMREVISINGMFCPLKRTLQLFSCLVSTCN